MKLSLLIANYNNGKFFKDCYDSIINQTYSDWEAVILDDASTDNSVELIQEIVGNDERFRILINKENKGVGFTKKKLIDLAEGELCAFLDPDDALFPNAIEYSVNVLKKNQNINSTYSRLVFCDENLEIKKVLRRTIQIDNNKYFFNCPNQVSAFFTFKKEDYNKTSGINTDLKSAVDQDLYLKILEHGSPKFINKVLYKYRIHNGGISQNDLKPKAKENFAKVIFETFKRRNIEDINGNPVPKKFTSADEIFKLLEYQNSVAYRLKKRVRILFQNI